MSDIGHSGVAAELPRYRCHKEVWALKIGAIVRHYETEPPAKGYISGATITPLDLDYASFEVDRNFVLKHDPQPGGYFVVYKDGYRSFSPAVAFEEGYTRI